MPGTNGYEATRAITRDEATRNIPVIICTARTSRPTGSGACARARDYLTKPVDIDALIEKIHALS